MHIRLNRLCHQMFMTEWKFDMITIQNFVDFDLVILLHDLLEE